MNKKFLDIITHYGVMPQLKYFQSEVFELNEAIIEAEEFKRFNDRYNMFNFQNIAEEIADVVVMLKQLQHYYNISDEQIMKNIDYKVERQLNRIKEEKNGN